MRKNMHKNMSTCQSVSQFSHSVVSNSLQPHGLQHTRPPGPSPTPGVYSNLCLSSCHFLCPCIPLSSVKSLSGVQLFMIPLIAAHQASLSITNSWSSLELMTIQSIMPSSHLILCCPLLLLPPYLPRIRVFSKESALRMRWPKYWSFSFSISPSKEHPGLISFRMD